MDQLDSGIAVHSTDMQFIFSFMPFAKMGSAKKIAKNKILFHYFWVLLQTFAKNKMQNTQHKP